MQCYVQKFDIATSIVFCDFTLAFVLPIENECTSACSTHTGTYDRYRLIVTYLLPYYIELIFSICSLQVPYVPHVVSNFLNFGCPILYLGDCPFCNHGG